MPLCASLAYLQSSALWDCLVHVASLMRHQPQNTLATFFLNLPAQQLAAGCCRSDAFDRLFKQSGPSGRLKLEAKKPVILVLGTGWGAHSLVKVRQYYKPNCRCQVPLSYDANSMYCTFAQAWDALFSRASRRPRAIRRLHSCNDQSNIFTASLCWGGCQVASDPTLLLCGCVMQVIDVDQFEVVVVSPRNHFLFTPML
jgi:hypothetical protein